VDGLTHNSVVYPRAAGVKINPLLYAQVCAQGYAQTIFMLLANIGRRNLSSRYGFSSSVFADRINAEQTSS